MRDFYYANYGGEKVQGCEFDRYLTLAQNYVLSHVRGTYTELPDNVKMAICAIIDLEADYSNIWSNGSIKSQNIDGLSVTFNSSDDAVKQYKRAKLEILKQYLGDMAVSVQWI